MAINKVIYGGETLIDLTGDTVTADKILSGFTAHDKGGEPITGTCDRLPSFVMGGKAGKNLISGYGIAGQVDQCLSTIDYFVNSHILSSSLLEIKKRTVSRSVRLLLIFICLLNDLIYIGTETGH